MKSFSTPIAAQSSDRFVYVSPLVNGYSAGPTILYNVTVAYITAGGGNGVNNRRSFFQSSLSSWPASFTPSSYGSDGSGYIPFIALG